MPKNSKRLTGLNPLAYMGVEADTPPQLVLETRSPTVNDSRYYNIGTLWIVSAGMEVWMLVDLGASRPATWIQLFPCAPGAASIFHTDSGDALPINAELNVFGDTVVTTSGSGNTVTVNLSQGTDGQVLIGATGMIPQWANITSTGGSVTVSNGSNTINLEVATVGATSYVTDSGTATPSMNAINILGGSNINTEGAGDTVTINLNDNVVIPGTLTVETLDRGVVQSDANGLLFADEGTDGQVIISSSTGAPTWANITSIDGSIDITNGANTIDLAVASGLGQRAAFLARQPSSVTTILGDTTTYTLGTVVAMSEIFDTASAFYPGDGAGAAATFTAPEDGKYFLSQFLHYRFNTTPSNRLGVQVRLVTSNRSYLYRQDHYYTSSFTFMQGGFSVLADMDEGDTASWQTIADNGGTSGGMYLFGQATTELLTFVSGFRAA